MQNAFAVEYLAGLHMYILDGMLKKFTLGFHAVLCYNDKENHHSLFRCYVETAK